MKWDIRHKSPKFM